MEPSLNDIDDMIVHEKMQAALEHQNEAWADGMADGIEPEIIAEMLPLRLPCVKRSAFMAKTGPRPC